MNKLELASLLITKGFVKTRFHEGKFQVKITEKGKDALYMLHRLDNLS